MLFKRYQAGSSLIETMIALFILAVGLLGFAGLLSNSLTMNQRAFTLSQAMSMAHNYAERMRVNRSSASTYGISITQDPPSSVMDCLSLTCSQTQLAEWDKKQWFDRLAATIPGADAEVLVNIVGDEITVDIEVQYSLRVGSVGKGSAASVTQMQNILSKLESYKLSTEI